MTNRPRGLTSKDIHPLSPKPLAVDRAITTNTRRLAMIVSYGVACAALLLLGVPLPREMFMLFVAWTGTALLYHMMLRRARTRSAANGIQLFGFCADVSFLTWMFALIGGAWWVGAMVHGFILTFAFSSLPRRLALVVAGYAIAGFFIMIAAHRGTEVLGRGTSVPRS